MVIAERNNQFEIALPAVRGHVYKAGSWLGETVIAPRAQLQLESVTPGTAGIYNKDFLIHVPPAYPLTAAERAATLIVPRPNEVLRLLRATDAGKLGGSAGPRQTLAEVVVLVYDFADEAALYLDRHYWQPAANGGAVSLHVIATSEVAEGAQHEQDTQAVLRRVFGSTVPGTVFPGIDYKKYNQGFPRPLTASWMDPTHPNFGDLNDPPVPAGAAALGRHAQGMHVVESNGDFAFALAELEHPASRAQRLLRLGRMHQQKRRIEGLWHRPDPLDGGDMSSCGPMSGN
jgi:hypothetical protein